MNPATAMERGEVEVVLCTEMTRLYRRLEELLDLIRLAERSNLTRIETTDGSGYYLYTGEGVHAAVSSVNNAVLESRKISDRVKRKHRARAQAGLTNGGSRRYGYEIEITLDPTGLLELTQCVGQGTGIELHAVLGEPLDQFFIGLETITTALDRGADIRCQCVGLVVRAGAVGHDVQRVTRVPLRPDELSDILEPDQHLGQLVRVEGDTVLPQTFG
jgi:hypothetical protein